MYFLLSKVFINFYFNQFPQAVSKKWIFFLTYSALHCLNISYHLVFQFSFSNFSFVCNNAFAFFFSICFRYYDFMVFIFQSCLISCLMAYKGAKGCIDFWNILDMYFRWVKFLFISILMNFLKLFQKVFFLAYAALLCFTIIYHLGFQCSFWNCSFVCNNAFAMLFFSGSILWFYAIYFVILFDMESERFIKAESDKNRNKNYIKMKLNHSRTLHDFQALKKYRHCIVGTSSVFLCPAT